jgi:subtilisin family serine protease
LNPKTRTPTDCRIPSRKTKSASNRRLRRRLGVVWCFVATAAFGELAPTWLFLDTTPTTFARNAISETGAVVRTESRWFRAVSVLADEPTVARLRLLPFVKGTAPVRRFARTFPPNAAPAAPGQIGVSSAAHRALVKVDRLHDRHLYGDGVRVGVLDTGFRTTHRAFRGLRIAETYDFLHGDEVVRDEPGQDDDEDGHGTQILAVLGGSLLGEFVGVAPSAEFYLAKTEDVSDNGREVEIRAEEDYWIAGLEWCVERGCRVVNSSLGYPTFYTFRDLDGETALITLAAEEAFRRGTLVVNAGGNSNGVPPQDNSLRGRIAPPADGEHVLAVGAATSDGSPSSQSSQGPTLDGRIKPDGIAPGVDIVTVSSVDDTTFVRVSGTSVSTPFAAGIVALLVQAFPQATAQDYLDALRATASLAKTPNNRAGYGVFNAEAAYESLATRYTPTPVLNTRQLLPSEWGRIKRDTSTGYLRAPYPNPARKTLNVPLFLNDTVAVRIGVVDATGRWVCRLVDGVLDAGTHTLRWDGREQNGSTVASGIYRIALSLPNATYVRGFLWRGE